MLGVGIDPRFNQMDYSGFVNAANINAQAQAQLGRDIGGAISSVAQGSHQKKKENQVLNATKKASEMQIQSAMNLFGDTVPGFKEQAQAALTQMNDPSLSLFEQASIGQNAAGMIQNSLKMMVDREQLEALRARRASMGGGSTASVATPNAGQQIIF
jgi:hypothetical protein